MQLEQVEKVSCSTLSPLPRHIHVCSLSFVLTVLGRSRGAILVTSTARSDPFFIIILGSSENSVVTGCFAVSTPNANIFSFRTLQLQALIPREDRWLEAGGSRKEGRTDSAQEQSMEEEGDHRTSRCVCLAGSRVPDSCCCYCCCFCYFTLTIVLRQGLAMQPWLTWNLWCRLG